MARLHRAVIAQFNDLVIQYLRGGHYLKSGNSGMDLQEVIPLPPSLTHYQPHKGTEA